MRLLPPLLLVASTLFGTQPAFAGTCDVVDYASWREAPGQSWDFHWPAAAEPKLTMIGAEHSRDPAHAQFARIDQAFASARHTAVFFEGPDRGTRAGAEQTIRETGESGYVRFLAARHALPARSLEPSPPERFKRLAADFPVDQVMLFFVLRETARMRDREGKTGEALDAAVAALLAKTAPLAAATLGSAPFSGIDGLRAAAARYWPGRDWRSLPANWFSPLADDVKTGGIFLGAINRADSTNRNRHMVALLAAAVTSGERPFVVVGRNHVPMQAPALKCALELAR